MRFSAVLSTAILTLGASAAPQGSGLATRSDAFSEILTESDLYARDDGDTDGSNDEDFFFCLDKNRAQQVATNFRQLIADYSNTLANNSLTTDYTDYSDSVNELINNGCPTGPVPLGSPTFTSRAAFEQGQGGQPPIPFKQLNVWHSCHAVTLRWVSAMTPEQVTGIIVLETVLAPIGSKYTDLIKTVYSEFNSGAWLYNLGICKPAGC